MQCSMAAYDKACAGAGELLKVTKINTSLSIKRFFQDIARFQVAIGSDRLNETAQKENETNQHIVLNYLKNLPAKCAYMQDEELFLIVSTAVSCLDSGNSKKNLFCSLCQWLINIQLR